jgi:hypothetical protein
MTVLGENEEWPERNGIRVSVDELVMTAVAEYARTHHGVSPGYVLLGWNAKAELLYFGWMRSSVFSVG